jgi:hypothetical protein
MINLAAEEQAGERPALVLMIRRIYLRTAAKPSFRPTPRPVLHSRDGFQRYYLCIKQL